ncbi:peptide alpha-N-acetyltransferas-like protein Nat2 [Plenodomus tracheiphilus IPT5]|uniref:Peptide alpha-N-acetyltransferas-like protein Nat2 n=1 Tax=Plenodomus tracheiphilus IPT5 TaxID=1408161 RepID=A0A6A7ATR6_9PLEO|nr:peptide alpha-N-acetyltransferas-like protein Nat2 [Plenodomus tracheiphilus IPT5]
MKTRVARLWTQQLLFGGVARKSASRPSAPFLRNLFTSTQSSARSSLQHRTLQQSALVYLRFQRSALARRFRSIRYKSDKPNSNHINPTPHLGSPEPALSISQRLKQLSKEYGWTAVGVYFALSAIDFPICFLAVRLLGTDRIGHYEDVVKNAFWSVIRLAFPDAGKRSPEEVAAKEAKKAAEATAREGYVNADGVLVRPSNADASIWTQLGLAYLVHKSLMFLRVPLTAAVLPKVVKTLRGWGYNIGKKKPKKSAPKPSST